MDRLLLDALQVLARGGWHLTDSLLQDDQFRSAGALDGLVSSLQTQLGDTSSHALRARLEYEFQRVLLQLSSDQQYTAMLVLSEELVARGAWAGVWRNDLSY